MNSFNAHSERIGLWLMVGCCAIGAILVWHCLLWPWIRGKSYRIRVQKQLCHRCGYDISKTTSKVCSECGSVLLDAAALRHYPFRWTGAIAGMFLLYAGVNARWVCARWALGERWTALVPTTVVVAGVNVDVPRKVNFLSEAVPYRLVQMWKWQNTFGEWRQSGKLKKKDLAALLQWREKWPLGADVVFRINPDAGYSTLFGKRTVAVEPIGDSGKVFSNMYGLGGDYRKSKLPAGSHVFRFRITDTEPDGSTLTLDHEIDIEVMPKGVYVLRAVESEEIVKAAAGALALGAGKWKSDKAWELQVGVNTSEVVVADVTPVSMQNTPGLGIAYDIEVLDGDRVVSHIVMDQRSYSKTGWLDPEFERMSRFDEQTGRYRLPVEVTNRLIVHIRGNETPVAQSLDAKSFWMGEAHVKLSDVVSKRNQILDLRVDQHP